VSKRVLISGFEPFGGESSNPSELVARALDGEVIKGRRVVAVALPVVFDESRNKLESAIDEVAPELVICLGLAANRPAVSIERVAINLDDATMPDNRGHQPIDRRIEAMGPAAYWSTLPIKAIRARLLAARIPGEISQSAGTYVCNHVFYGLMHQLNQKTGIRGGFIHIPRAASDEALANLVKAIRLSIEVGLTREIDLKESGGALS
jgi:pyroglutamyl-peptidase